MRRLFVIKAEPRTRPLSTRDMHWESRLRRSAENKLKVVAVRVEPAIEQRLRILAEATGRKQSFFLQQMIESGIAAMEERWLSPQVLEQVKSGALQSLQPSSGATSDLFGDMHDAQAE